MYFMLHTYSKLHVWLESSQICKLNYPRMTLSWSHAELALTKLYQGACLTAMNRGRCSVTYDSQMNFHLSRKLGLGWVSWYCNQFKNQKEFDFWQSSNGHSVVFHGKHLYNDHYSCSGMSFESFECSWINHVT